MITVTTIDIIKDKIYCYDEETDERVIYPLVGVDTFMNEFSDTQDLLTVNITDPLARLIKFYAISESEPESFIILDYTDMTAGQKVIFDEFIIHIQTL